MKYFLKKLAKPLRLKPIRAAFGVIIAAYLTAFGIDTTTEAVAQWVGVAVVAILAWVGDNPETS